VFSSKSTHPLNVAVVGLGAVGAPLVERLLAAQKHENSLFRLVGVCARRPKAWVRQTGITFYNDPMLLAARAEVDVVIEAMGGVAQAHQVVGTALSHGKHVVTANATLMAGYGKTLFKTARVHGVRLGCEAAVLGNVPLPALTGVRQPAHRLSMVFGGGLSGVLARMQANRESFVQAVHHMQQGGQVDPSGKEDFYRLTLLRALVFGVWGDVARPAIPALEELTAEDLAIVDRFGGTLRLVGSAAADDISLTPMLLPQDHAFAVLAQDMEGVQLETPSGELTFTAPGRSAATAVEGMMNDLYATAQRIPLILSQRQAGTRETGTGAVFVRVPLAVRSRLRQDARMTVMQEEVDPRREVVSAIMRTHLPPAQVQAALCQNSLAFPVWRPVQEEGMAALKVAV
jgi:homoserine dehydrogenase